VRRATASPVADDQELIFDRGNSVNFGIPNELNVTFVHPTSLLQGSPETSEDGQL
jgi:hypothetical protein